MQEYDLHEDQANKYIHYMRVQKTNELDFIQLGYHNTPPLYGYGPMVRHYHLIHFVTRGSGKLHLRGNIYCVHAGECFLIPPYEIASYVSDKDDPWEYYWLGFTGFSAAKYAEKAGFTRESPVIHTDCIKEIQQAFQMVDGYYTPDKIMLYKSITYQVLYYLTVGETIPSCRASKGDNSSSKHDYVGKVVSIIETSYDQRLPIVELADMMSINRNYLCKIFKEKMGMSIKSFLTDYRLNMAVAMLSKSEKTIAEVAVASGFQDPLYFSRLFKKRFGVSPSRYGSDIPPEREAADIQ